MVAFMLIRCRRCGIALGAVAREWLNCLSVHFRVHHGSHTSNLAEGLTLTEHAPVQRMGQPSMHVPSGTTPSWGWVPQYWMAAWWVCMRACILVSCRVARVEMGGINYLHGGCAWMHAYLSVARRLLFVGRSASVQTCRL